MFIVVVAFLLVLILGVVMFTDVVDNGSLSIKSIKSATLQFLKGTDSQR